MKKLMIAVLLVMSTNVIADSPKWSQQICDEAQDALISRTKFIEFQLKELKELNYTEHRLQSEIEFMYYNEMNEALRINVWEFTKQRLQTLKESGCNIHITINITH